MCEGINCPMKNECYRYTAPVGLRQSYFAETPIKDGKDCEYYWKTQEDDDEI